MTIITNDLFYAPCPKPTHRVTTYSGEEYDAIDIGCEDFEAAKENRFRIENKIATAWWKRMEDARDLTPPKEDLPDWIPVNHVGQS